MLIKIKEKKCKRCNSDEWYVEKKKIKGTQFNCKKCLLDSNKKNVRKRREFEPGFTEKWKDYAKNYYKNNRKKCIKNIGENQKKHKENLTDSYIRGYLYRDIYISHGISIKLKNFPQEIIDKTREILIIKRELKNENKKEVKRN